MTALHVVAMARYLAIRNLHRKIRHVQPWVEGESSASRLSRSNAIKGPGLRIVYDVRRFWKCPECGRTERSPVDTVARKCSCRSEGIWMTLIEPAPAPPPFEVPVAAAKDTPEPETDSANSAPTKTDGHGGQTTPEKRPNSDDQNKPTQVETSESAGDSGSTDSAGTQTPVPASTDAPPVSE